MILNWNIINYGIQNVAAKILYPNIYQENKLVFARWSFASCWIVINCIKCQEHTIYGCFSLHYIILKMVNIRACINSSWPATISLVSSSKSKPKIRTTTHASGSVLSEKKNMNPTRQTPTVTPNTHIGFMEFSAQKGHKYQSPWWPMWVRQGRAVS